jgi:hypothetical protein
MKPKNLKRPAKRLAQRPLLVAGLTMEQWIANETRRRKTTWWGQPCYIKPVIHSKIFGDGLQLAYLGTIDQRPQYWLIRVDSGLDLCADNFDYEKHLLEPLEDEFGRFPETYVHDGHEFQKLKREGHWEISDYENYKDYLSSRQYPRLWWGGGHWGAVANFKTGECGE